MTEEKVLGGVLDKLEKLNVPYALTGALAASFYGKPRATHDLDIIVQLYSGAGQIKSLKSAFERDYYISEEGMIDALVHKTMFNIIHHETGLKIDLWILKESEYDREAFNRRRKVKALGRELFILAPEDMIINKLQWYKISDIQKHLLDAQGIYELQAESLDMEYLKRWALKLSLFDLLKQLGFN